MLGSEDPKAFAREKRRLANARWRAKNPLASKESTKKSMARWRAKNPLANRDAAARWRAKNPQAYRDAAARYRAENPQACKEATECWRLKKAYGLSIVERQNMLDKQCGLCAICGNFMESPHVDHCHATGKIRGLLCSTCNTGLGHFKDNPMLCFSAGEYLKKGGV